MTGYGLKKRATYNEIIQELHDNQDRIKFPDRKATFIRDSNQYQTLINNHLTEVQQHQENTAKHDILINEARRQTGGNHEINKGEAVQHFDISGDDVEMFSEEPEGHDVSGSITEVLQSIDDSQQIQASESARILNEQLASQKQTDVVHKLVQNVSQYSSGFSSGSNQPPASSVLQTQPEPAGEPRNRGRPLKATSERSRSRQKSRPRTIKPSPSQDMEIVDEDMLQQPDSKKREASNKPNKSNAKAKSQRKLSLEVSIDTLETTILPAPKAKADAKQEPPQQKTEEERAQSEQPKPRQKKQARASSEPPNKKHIENNLQLLREEMEQLKNRDKMNTVQKSEYLKLDARLKPGYKKPESEEALSKVQIRQKMKSIYREIIKNPKVLKTI
jgi:hypothetical protein